MKKNITRLSLLVIVVSLIFVSQLVMPKSNLANPGEAIARTIDTAIPDLYMPIILTRFLPQQPSMFGIDMGRIRPASGLKEMRSAGSYWIRRDGVSWAKVEPNKGDREWGGALNSLEKDLINAQNSDMSVILIVTQTPTWAQEISGLYCGPIKPTELEAFGNFMYDLVERYSKPPYNVKYWEIWNEPDAPYDPVNMPPDTHYGCWGDVSEQYFGGEAYGDMLQAVYPRIKDADPNAQVLVGGLLLDCDPTLNSNPNPGQAVGCKSTSTEDAARFLEGILVSGGGDYFDGISFHAYDYYYGVFGSYGNTMWGSTWSSGGPVVSAKVDYINGILASADVTGKFLMNTETALICGNSGDEPGMPGCESNSESDFEVTKANYVAQVYAESAALDLDAGIWYSALGWRNSGLLNDDLSTRPAYTAYAVARRALINAQFVRKIDSFPSVEGYVFNRGGRTVWVLWSTDGNPHTVNLIPVPNYVYDAMGTPIQASTSLQVDQTPKYLEWYP